MKQEIEVYLKRLKDKGYTQEELEYVKQFRESLEHMTFEQYLFFRQNNMIESSRRLKKPRNLFVDQEGVIWYLNHRYRKYNYCAKFKGE